MTGRERILNAAAGKPADSLPHIPISMMIAAAQIGEPYGRYVLDADVHARGQVAFADKSRLGTLKPPDPGSGRRMSKRLETIRRLKQEAGSEKAVEGWIEGPIAESCDLRGINTLMLDFYDDPGFVRDLMAFVFEMEMRFAREQVRAGIDVMGVGDAAASLIGPRLYRAFAASFRQY